MTGLDPMWQCFAVALAAWTCCENSEFGVQGWCSYGPGLVQLGVSHHDWLGNPLLHPQNPRLVDILPRLGRGHDASMKPLYIGCEKPVRPSAGLSYPTSQRSKKDTEKP